MPCQFPGCTYCLHVDDIAKLGTATTTSLFDSVISEGIGCCVVHTKFIGSCAVFAHPGYIFCCCLLCYSFPSSPLLSTTLHSLVQINTFFPLCDQNPLSPTSFSSRLRYYQESAFSSQSVHGELPIGGVRVVPAQKEAADPKPADPAQPERALCRCKRPGHQDPA